MATTMSANGGGEIHEDVELLKLTRACDGQEARDGTFTVLTAIAKTDLPPLHGVAEGALRPGMPRAGLCRVVEFAPIDFEFHLGADAA